VATSASWVIRHKNNGFEFWYEKGEKGPSGYGLGTNPIPGKQPGAHLGKKRGPNYHHLMKNPSESQQSEKLIAEKPW